MGKRGRDQSELLVPSRKRKPAEDDLAFNHVSKKQSKSKGVEVVFNPTQHREFITGFRKRKLQRRAEAEKLLKIKEKRTRLESRAERRAALKEELGLGDKWGASSEDEPEPKPKPKAAAAAPPPPGAAAPRVAVYEGQGTRTTVVTAPLELYPNSDPEEGEEEENSNEDDDGQAAQAGMDQLRGGQRDMKLQQRIARARADAGRKVPAKVKPKKQAR